MALTLVYFSSVIVVTILAGASEAAPKQEVPRLRRKFSTPAAASATDSTTKGVLTGVQSFSWTPSLVATDASVADLATRDNKIIFAARVGTGIAARLPGVPRLRRIFSTPAAAVTTGCSTKSCDSGDQIPSSAPPKVATDLQLPKITSTMSSFALSSDTLSSESNGNVVRRIGEQRGTRNGTISDDGAFDKREHTYGVKFGPGTMDATTTLLTEPTTLTINVPLPIHRRTTIRTRATSHPMSRPYPK